MKGINLSFTVWMEHEFFSYHFILLDQGYVSAYHMEHCNSWLIRSWRKATVNILEHQSTRSWWILSARVCIVDCIRVKAHKFNRVSKQETLDLNPWHTKHVKCFYSDHVNSLGWMIEVLSFTGTKLYSQLPSPPRRIDKNQPFPPSNIDSHLTSPYNITSESLMEVMRIEEVISKKRSSWLLKKFFKWLDQDFRLG